MLENVEKADSQKELWEGKNLMKNPFPVFSLTLEKKHQTGEARSEGYMQCVQSVQSLTRDFCLGCQIATGTILFPSLLITLKLCPDIYIFLIFFTWD